MKIKVNRKIKIMSYLTIVIVIGEMLRHKALSQNSKIATILITLCLILKSVNLISVCGRFVKYPLNLLTFAVVLVKSRCLIPGV